MICFCEVKNMATSNLLEIMLKHDRWATRLILEKCGTLTEEQFNRKFEMGPGSLHATITHMFAAQRFWSDLLAGREQRPRLEGSGQRTPGELAVLLDEVAGEYDAVAVAYPLEEFVYRVRDGKTYAYTRGAVVTHVATHGMHHRAQCLNMMRQLGVSPLPPSSVAEWQMMGEK
jgi:uncharacterized damage-inducible protein DinB